MTVDTMRDSVERALSDGNGILRLKPAWVARDFLPAGRRFGLSEDVYDLGERGAICERWLASTTRADNRVGPSGEGLSYLALDGPERISLQEAVAADPALLMGAEYAATHDGLGRLAKIFDYSTRLPLHLHQRSEHAALVGRRSKEEAYYLPPGVEMGPHPETSFGCAESRPAAASPAGLEQRPDLAALGGLPAGKRARFPRSCRGPARSGQRADDRA